MRLTMNSVCFSPTFLLTLSIAKSQATMTPVYASVAYNENMSSPSTETSTLTSSYTSNINMTLPCKDTLPLCKTMLKQCDNNQVRKSCRKSCGICSVNIEGSKSTSIIATTSTSSSVISSIARNPNQTSTGDCNDIWDHQECSRIKLYTLCSSAYYYNFCKETCGCDCEDDPRGAFFSVWGRTEDGITSRFFECKNNEAMCLQGWFAISCMKTCLSCDPCKLKPCRNGGSCELEMGSFKCDCLEKFHGERCEYNDTYVKTFGAHCRQVGAAKPGKLLKTVKAACSKDTDCVGVQRLGSQYYVCLHEIYAITGREKYDST